MLVGEYLGWRNASPSSWKKGRKPWPDDAPDGFLFGGWDMVIGLLFPL